MPPSPSSRRCPKEIFHKRRHSFGSILPVKPKDDELLLFTDMQRHERNNFLLEPGEDFNESISKFSYFRDCKIGDHIATRGENHDFLNVGGGRNDYDWLLTPPETPLFRSLDDEEHHHIGLARRGRALIKPISISRSSTMESTRRTNRSSDSPNRLSPSPRSCSSTVLTRTRSSNSSSRCSPPLALQPSTPSRRSSTPPASKTFTPPRRSPSPASRRMSTGSSDPTLNGKRGTSTVKANQRSSSPRLQGWQSSDPGFSFEAPPNLRTSLPDRLVSRSRGGSPSSFSGLDIGWRGRTQSMSPTPSRRASSSYSNDRDRFSSYSKTSVTSSADDDLDSMHSVSISYSRSPAVRKNLVMKTRTASLKKPSKSFSPISAPKQSFDSAVWLMDHHKAPQDMFRPLLSSVPSHTFSAGKGNNAHQHTVSHNPSVTISSNTSSEHGPTLGPCTDIEKEQHDAISECEAVTSSVRPECPQCSFSSDQSGVESLATEKSAERTKNHLGFGRSIEAQASCNATSSSEVEHGKMATCARCGKLFSRLNVDGEVDYCEECALMDGNCFVDSKIQNLEEAHQQDVNVTNSEPCITSEAPHLIPDSSESINDSYLDSQLVNDELQGDCLQWCPPSQSTVGTNKEMLSGQHVENVMENKSSSHQCSVSDCQQVELTSVNELRDQSSDHHNGNPQCLLESICDMDFVSDSHTIDNSHELGSTGHPNLNTKNTAGIPLLLLQKSSSNKWPIVDGRTFSPTNILYSEPYYERDNVNMSKCTTGRDSSSASSSIDQGSSRQSDVHYYIRDNVNMLKCTIGRGSSSALSTIDQGSSRQSDAQWEHLKSSIHYEFEKAPISSTMSCQSVASMSDISSNGSVSVCPQSNAVADTGFLTDNSETGTSRTIICTEELDGSCKYNQLSAIECWSAAQAFVNDDSELFEDAAIQNRCMSGMVQEDNLNACLSSSDIEMRSNIPVSLAPVESCIQDAEEASATTQCYSISTKENANNVCGSDNKLDNCGVSIISEEDMLISATEMITIELPGNDESPVTVEGSKGKNQRCFTLEEAADAILFCRSIVHDTAYRAATIGLEREQKSELAAAHPTVTMVEKSIRKGDSSLKLPHRPKHRKKSEVGAITETAKMEVVAKNPVPVRLVPERSRTSDSMKPPKLESKCNCSIM